jgi:hypothetical protein
VGRPPYEGEKLDHFPITIDMHPQRKFDTATRQIQIALLINLQVNHCHLKQAAQPLDCDFSLLEYLWAWDVIACKRYDL